MKNGSLVRVSEFTTRGTMCYEPVGIGNPVRWLTAKEIFLVVDCDFVNPPSWGEQIVHVLVLINTGEIVVVDRDFLREIQ